MAACMYTGRGASIGKARRKRACVREVNKKRGNGNVKVQKLHPANACSRSIQTRDIV